MTDRAGRFSGSGSFLRAPSQTVVGPVDERPLVSSTAARQPWRLTRFPWRPLASALADSQGQVWWMVVRSSSDPPWPCSHWQASHSSPVRNRPTSRDAKVARTQPSCRCRRATRSHDSHRSGARRQRTPPASATEHVANGARTSGHRPAAGPNPTPTAINKHRTSNDSQVSNRRRPRRAGRPCSSRSREWP
jgi:hypothetical protein